MKGLLAGGLLGILALCGSLRGGSIFDPNSDPDSGPRSSSAKPPASAVPSVPRNTQISPAPAPVHIPDPAPPANPLPQDNTAPAPSAGQHALDDDMNALETNAITAIAAARKAVEEYRKAAEDKTIAALEATQQYQIALAQSNHAEKNLEETRITGDTAQKARASAAAAKAAAKLNQMHDNAIANSDELRHAKQLEAVFAPAAPAAPNPQAPPTVNDEIAKAILNRQLVPGMTLKQAEQAAGMPADFVSQSHDRTRYRWRIMGITGTTPRLWTDALGHVRQTEEQRQGMVAEVHATFIDGKLDSFDRFNFRN